jgi:hypothetical protein
MDERRSQSPGKTETISRREARSFCRPYQKVQILAGEAEVSLTSVSRESYLEQRNSSGTLVPLGPGQRIDKFTPNGLGPLELCVRSPQMTRRIRAIRGARGVIAG